MACSPLAHCNSVGAPLKMHPFTHSTFTEFRVFWWGGWSERPAAEGSSSAGTKATVRLQPEIKNFKPRRMLSCDNNLLDCEKEFWMDGMVKLFFNLSYRRRCHPAVIRRMMMHRTNLNISSTQCEKTNPDCLQIWRGCYNLMCGVLQTRDLLTQLCYRKRKLHCFCRLSPTRHATESTALIYIKRLSHSILSFLPQGLSLNPLKHISCGFMGVVFFIVKQLQLLMRLCDVTRSYAPLPRIKLCFELEHDVM